MDIEAVFLRAMAQAIDDCFMRGGPHPTDDVLISIAPELACLLDTDEDEPYEDEWP